MTTEDEKLEFFGSTKNYYQILGIGPEADQKQIKDAYIRLAKMVHPDHNNMNDRQMIELNLIYEVLSHPDKKKEYDERFIEDKVFDFSKPRPERTAEAPKARNEFRRDVNPLKVLRVGLTVVLICLLTYLVFYLAVNILHFVTTLPDWLLKLAPTTL